MYSTFGTNLKILRTFNGLTVEELASEIGCSKQAISNYENSLRHPDGTVLMSFAKFFNVDLDYFFGPLPVRFKLNNVKYREGRSLTKSQQDNIESLTAEKLSKYLELETLTKDYIKFENPIKELKIKNKKDAEGAAIALRRKWKLGDGAIASISSIIERKGIRLIKIKFAFYFSLEGLSGWAEDGKVPVIVVNDSGGKDICRTRFTLLHELGHLLLDLDPNLDEDNVENLCNTFAGAVLLPYEVLSKEFGVARTTITISELIRIKELYGISVKSIMVRAMVCNLISRSAYDNWDKIYESLTNRGSFAGIEEPTRFDALLMRAIGEKIIGLDKAAKIAGQDIVNFRFKYEQDEIFL